MINAGTFRLGVLGSGRGSNFAAIAEAIKCCEVPAEVVTVISDVENAGILQHAKQLGIPGQFIDPGKYRTKLDEGAEQAYITALQSAQVT